MKRNVQIIDRREIFQKFVFRIEEVRLRHERFDGSLSDEIVRLNLDRGDSVAGLVHDTERDTVVLCEQFRYPTVEKGPGWILELPAGILEQGEEPIESIRREILEEVGYQADRCEHIATVYLSPGGSSERIHVYYVPLTPDARTSEGGGVASEGEDIRIVQMQVTGAMEKMRRGEIVDAKTLIALQWLQLHRSGTS